MAKITRNPFDGQQFGYFVSEWYGFYDNRGNYRPGVIVEWQGQRDAESRILFPWEFIRANEQTKSIDWLIAGDYQTTAEVKTHTEHAGSIGKIKIHNAPLQDCGKCIAAMQGVNWWQLNPQKDHVIHKIASGTAAYTEDEISAHLKMAEEFIE